MSRNLLSGLIGRYTFENSLANVLPGGTAPAFAGGTPTYAAGKVGNGLATGTPSATFTGLFTPPFSYAFWFFATAGANGTPGVVEVGGGSHALDLDLTGGVCSWTMLSPSRIASGTISTGVWHHAAYTWSGSLIRFFIDGAQVLSGTELIGPTTDNFLLNADGTDFHTPYDELLFYKAFLSPQQVKLIYDNVAVM